MELKKNKIKLKKKKGKKIVYLLFYSWNFKNFLIHLSLTAKAQKRIRQFRCSIIWKIINDYMSQCDKFFKTN